MPILAENRQLYPADWPEISHRIRFDRAQGRCECDGRCGRGHQGRCEARHGHPHPDTGSSVVLTTMHLDHDETHCDDANLMAGCQACHNAYDAAHRRQTRRRRKAAADLFDDAQATPGRPDPTPTRG